MLNYHIGCIVLGFFVLELGCGCATAGSPDTTLAETHPNSNTQQTEKVTASVIVQHSRKILKMDILMPETCWFSKKKIKLKINI